MVYELKFESTKRVTSFVYELKFELTKRVTSIVYELHQLYKSTHSNINYAFVAATVISLQLKCCLYIQCVGNLKSTMKWLCTVTFTWHCSSKVTVVKKLTELLLIIITINSFHFHEWDFSINSKNIKKNSRSTSGTFLIAARRTLLLLTFFVFQKIFVHSVHSNKSRAHGAKQLQNRRVPPMIRKDCCITQKNM